MTYPIYLYNLITQKYLRVFETEDAFMRYLHDLRQREALYGVVTRFNITGNDTYFDPIENEHLLRELILIDNESKPVDPKDYAHKIDSGYIIPGTKRKYNHSRGSLLYKYHFGSSDYEAPFRYRIDPVPGTQRYARHYTGIRHMRYKCNITEPVIDEEYADMIKLRKRDVVTVYDDIPRNVQRSWKSQSKKRRQWMR